jgi:hypothetical protein
MAKKKKSSTSGTLPKANAVPSDALPRATRRAPAIAKAADTDGPPDQTGACRYTDSFGGMQCESPVTKAYCDGKGGDFTPDDRCV